MLLLAEKANTAQTRLRFTLLLLMVILSGCSKNEFITEDIPSYLLDRSRDLGDVLTATTGIGFGPKAQMGPVHLGCQLNMDCYGWRYGWVFPSRGEAVMGTACLEFTIGTVERSMNAPKRGKRFEATGGSGDKWVSFRKPQKDISTIIPILSTVKRASKEHTPLFHPYYTQVEASAGLLGSLRLGINPGEIVDFALGWVCIDFFDDDIGLNPANEIRREPNTEWDGKIHGFTTPPTFPEYIPPKIEKQDELKTQPDQ